MPPHVIESSSEARAVLVAEVVADAFRRHGVAVVAIVGVDAFAVALKAIILVKECLALEGKTVLIIPSFATVEVNGEERSVVYISVEELSARNRV